MHATAYIEITQTLWRIFTWNFACVFLIIMWGHSQRTITLICINTELFPLLDLEILVKVLHATITISRKIKDIPLKLCMCIISHHVRSLIKNYNSGLHYNWIIPHCELGKSWLRFCGQVHTLKLLKHYERYSLETLHVYSWSSCEVTYQEL